MLEKKNSLTLLKECFSILRDVLICFLVELISQNKKRVWSNFTVRRIISWPGKVRNKFLGCAQGLEVI